VCVPAGPRLRLGEPLKQADDASTEKKNMNNRTISHALKMATRATLLVAVVAAPLFIAQRVNAGPSQFIGEAPTMSTGAGLVLLAGLQRS